MRLYIQKPMVKGAWVWINDGYKLAWEKMDFDVIPYNDILEVDTDGDYHIMAWEYDIRNRQEAIQVIEKSKKAYFYAQPNYFPPPWGLHPNWQCSLGDEMIESINQMEHVHLWNFGDTKKEYFFKWKDILSLPLAFDSISYKPVEDSKCAYDICFVGGWANNGLNEKRAIMIEHFMEIKKLNLKCGIFINKDISLQDEANVLYNSNIAINIHDAYTRTVGCNYNERTFKSLGLTGFLISDKHTLLEKDFPDLPMAQNAKDMSELIIQYMDQDLTEIKEKNRLDILHNHTYINRVKKFISL